MPQCYKKQCGTKELKKWQKEHVLCEPALAFCYLQSIDLSSLPSLHPSFSISSRSGPTASTWSTCRGNRVSSSSARRKTPSASGWSSSRWPCTLQLHYCRNQSILLMDPGHQVISNPCRSNIKPERATANQHNFQMHTFEKNTNCRACKMLLRWGPPYTRAHAIRTKSPLARNVLLGLWADLYYMSCFSDWLYWRGWNYGALT